jgi:hypothetical protein
LHPHLVTMCPLNSGHHTGCWARGVEGSPHGDCSLLTELDLPRPLSPRPLQKAKQRERNAGEGNEPTGV